MLKSYTFGITGNLFVFCISKLFQYRQTNIDIILMANINPFSNSMHVWAKNYKQISTFSTMILQLFQTQKLSTYMPTKKNNLRSDPDDDYSCKD